MNSEKISVIVPAYNIAPWLPRCLDSLLAQTHSNLEIVAVDDGSQDESYSVMLDYASRDSRVKAVHQENGGVTSARLRGVAEATGDWIGFVDGDDAVEPWMYARLWENAHQYAADISHCGHALLFPDGTKRLHRGTGLLRQQDRNTAVRDLLEEKLVEPGLCTKLFKRELFSGLAEKMDYSLKINEDFLMNYFLFSTGERAVFEDVCPYRYIVREGSASRHKLNEPRIYDPIRVKQIILDTCGPQLREDARGCLVKTILIAYSLLALETDREYAVHRKKVRGMLLEQKAYFSLLTRRNALLARMVCCCPGLFRLAYRFYVNHVQDPYE